MKLRTLAVTCLLAFGLAGCDLLSTEPQQSVSPEVGLSSIEGLQGIAVSAYSRLRGADAYGQRQIIAPEILADNAIINAVPSGRYRGDERNQIGTGVGGWGTWYGLISDANYVLAGIDDVEAPTATKNTLKGEMLFLRALAYHNLARVYAYEPTKVVGGFDKGVIIRTEPVLQLTDADFRSRASVTEVYQLIEKDLKDAIGLLPAQTAATTRRYRASAATAEALLARVYLYWEKWQEAANYATAAMQHTVATLNSGADAATIFAKKPNPESIFEMNMNLTETLGVNDAISSIMTPLVAGWFDVVPSAELLALYEAGDTRRSGWYTAHTSTNAALNGVVYSTKYLGRTGNYADNVPIIRYSEMLLIRAEAYANLPGRGGDALTDLNTLRAARNASALAAGVDLAQTVADERRRELAFEGHRWFDLKRKGMDIHKPAATGVGTIPYSDFRRLAPIPQSQTELNPNLEQNPGYAND